ncbi:hypothetical protein KAH55_01135 [bacterium]|nr:hypothetical protein [bacterium]
MYKKRIALLSIFCVLLLGLILGQDTVKAFIKTQPVLTRTARKIMAMVKQLDRFRPNADSAKYDSNSSNSPDGVTSLFVDVTKIIGEYQPFYTGIGMGSFRNGSLKPYNKRFFDMLGDMNQKQRIFCYVNTKCIFVDHQTKGPIDDGGDVCTRTASGQLQYNWKIVDEVIDLFLENGLTPIISLTFMPEALAKDVNRKNPWNKGVISPPTDYNEWAELNYQTIHHLKQRYGKEEVCRWYFEVWNEPDLFQFFWIRHPDRDRFPNRGDNEEYFKLYDYAVDGALRAEPDINIGGPAMAGDMKLFLEPFLQHCFHETNYATGKKGTRVDFISRHLYGGMTRILDRYQKFIEMAKKSAGNSFDQLEILITETGPSHQPKAWLNNRYPAAWIAKEVAGMYHLNDSRGPEFLPDIMCYWTKPVVINFSTHFGLASALGSKWGPSPETMIKRPAFNGFEMVNQLEGKRLAIKGCKYGDTIHALAAQNDENTILLLVYHLNEHDRENTESRQFPVTITVNELDFDSGFLARYQVDQTHSNGFSAWTDAGSPISPTPAVLAEIQQQDDLLPIAVEEVQITNNSLEISLEIQANSVVLFKLIKSTY